MTIKIKMELTEGEAHALMAYHARAIVTDAYISANASAARIHDIAKRIQRARDASPKEPEKQQAPIAAAWPNS